MSSRLSVHLETDLAMKLKSSVERRQHLIQERDRINEEIGALSTAIGNEMALANQKTIRVGEFLATLVENQGRLTLDKHRLVELGVLPQTIAEATVRGAPSVTLQVRRVVEE